MNNFGATERLLLHRLAFIVLVMAGTLVWFSCGAPPPDTEPIRLVEAFSEATVEGTAPLDDLPEPTLWTFEDGTQSRVGEVAIRDVEVRSGALHAKANRRSVLVFPLTPDVAPAETVHRVEIAARVSHGQELTVRFSMGEKLDLRATLNSPFGAYKTPLRPGDETVKYSIPVSQTVTAGNARYLLVQPTDAAEADVAIDSVRVVYSGEHLAELGAGVSWLGLGERYHETVVARAPEVIELTRRLPANAIFSASVGTLMEGQAVTFTATAQSGREAAKVASLTVSEADTWNSLALELGDWSGREVTLRLAVDGDDGAVGFWGSAAVRSRQSPEDRPRGVILVIADTLRRDHLDLYGYERETAPTLTTLARAGVSFTDAISQATWTKVSVPSIQTSLYATTHTVADIPDRLPASAETIAEVFREAGYSTLGLTTIPFVGRLTSLHQGFEEFHEGASVDDELGPKSAAEHVRRLESWLAERGDEPFFVLLHVADPHSPYRPLPKNETTFAEVGAMDRLDELIDQVKPAITHSGLMQRFGMPRREELARAGIDAEEFLRLEKLGYDSSIRGLDQAMSSLVETLDRLGLTDDTLMAFVSDHGTEFLEHDAHFHGHTAFGELNRVPLFFWGPSFVPGNTAVRSTVQTIDLMPTVLEIAGLTVPEAAQGKSLVPFFTAPSMTWDRPAITELPMNLRGVTGRSIVHEGWKLIEYDEPDKPRFELYSHRDDPLNLVDLAAQNEDVVDRLRTLLGNWQRYAEAARLSPVLDTGSMSAEELERLQSLGYL